MRNIEASLVIFEEVLYNKKIQMMKEEEECRVVMLLAKNVIKKENKEAFLAFAKIMIEETRKEPGCLSYDLLADVETEDTYYFVEKYQDEAAVEAHRASAYFCTYVPQMRVLKAEGALTTGQVLEF